MKKRRICVAIITFGLMAMSACGDSTGDGQTAAQILADPSFDRSATFYGETLSMAVLHDFGVAPAIQRYRSLTNRGVDFEVIHFFRGGAPMDIDGARLQLSAQIMAGEAPVLIDSIFIDQRDPRISALLADWIPLMNADPDFNEDDVFINVLNALPVEGRLTEFPRAFTINAVAANTTIPGLPEALAALPAVTISDLMALREEFSTDDAPLYIDRDFNVWFAVRYSIDSFMDFNSRWVDFDSQGFIDFINAARAATNPGSPFEMTAFSSIDYANAQHELTQRYLFQIYAAPVSTKQMFTYELGAGALFLGATPLANLNGEIITFIMEGFLLNASATPMEQALAYDFVQYLITPRGVEGGRFFANHIHREAFRNHTLRDDDGMIANLERLAGLRVAEPIEESLENAYIIMSELGNMPMTTLRFANEAIENFIKDTLRDFHYGLISADQAAQMIQNRVWLVFAEMD